MIILRSGCSRPMQRALRGLLVIAIVIFLSWIASSWMNYESLRTPDPETAQAFVQWWVTKAFDNNSPDSINQHREAKSWMRRSTQKSFAYFFWPEGEETCTVEYKPGFARTSLSKPVCKGKVITVSVTGRWHGMNFRIPPGLMKIDFDVIKEPDGYRIADWQMGRFQIFRIPNSTPPKYGQEYLPFERRMP